MTKRTPIIAANWKMHKTGEEAESFIKLLKAEIPSNSSKIFIAPSFTALSFAAHAAKGTPFVIGAQNMHEAAYGAFTGEISAEMLKSAGAQFVILGHSERRKLFHESNHTIHLKLQKAFASNLLPILCVGETLEERNTGKTFNILTHQIKSALEPCHPAELVLAYEPVWAIGTGMAATPEMAQEAHHFCRKLLNEIWGANTIPILYGGSVTPETAPLLAKKPDIDGALVGGASLDVTKFSQIIQGFKP
jgi:triosephosphate isomerase